MSEPSSAPAHPDRVSSPANGLTGLFRRLVPKEPGPGVSRVPLGIWLAALAFLIAVSTVQFRSPTPFLDEGMLLTYPELILKGQLPYRDFETFYAPANLYLLSGTFAAFGAHIQVERSVGFFYHLAILAAVFALLKRQGATAALGAVVLAKLILLPLGVVAYAWLGGMACLLWSVVFLAGPPDRRRLSAAGFFAGAAILFRQDLGLAVLISALPWLVSLSWKNRFLYLGAAGVALLPLAGLVATAGFSPVLDNLLIYPVFKANSARHIRFDQAPDFVFTLVCLHFAAVVFSLGIAALLLQRQPKEPRSRLLFSLALLGACLSPQALQRLDIYHVCYVAFFPVAVLPVFLIEALRMARNAEVPFRWQCAVSTGVLAIFLFETAEPAYFYYQSLEVAPKRLGWQVNSAGRVIYFGTKPGSAAIQVIVDFLNQHGRAGERLFVGPGDLRRTSVSEVTLYHLLPHLVPASYFIELNPLSANRPGSRLAADLQHADWLVLNRALDRWNEANASQQQGSDLPNQMVSRSFDRAVEVGPYLIYRRKP